MPSPGTSDWDLIWKKKLLYRSCDCVKALDVRSPWIIQDVAPWTVACQAPLSMGFLRQEYWSGLLFLTPGDLPNPGIELWYPALQADSLPSEL